MVSELIRRRSLMAENSILPQGYTEISLLTNPDTAYFDTGVVRGLNALVKIVTSIRWNTLRTAALMFSDYGVYIGSRADGRWYNANTSATSLIAQTGVLYNVIMERISTTEQILTVNGSSVTTQRQQGVQKNIQMFNIDGTATYKCQCSMGRTQIFLDGVLVRDFVPCINPNNVYGMYDLTTSAFYSSQDSVQFTGE